MDWLTILILSAATIALIVSVEHETYIGGIISLVATGAALYFLGSSSITDIWNWLVANQTSIMWGALIYFAAGTVWAIAKWVLFLWRIKDSYSAFTQLSVAKQENTTFFSYLCSNENIYLDSLPPKVSQFKDKIVFWMIWWPFSMVWTILNDPVKRIFEFVYSRISGGMQSISNRMFSDISG